MEERRRHPRLRSLIGGSATFNNGHSTMECMLRNISQSGALLACSSNGVLPCVFDLFLPTKNRRLRMRIVWRDADRVGAVMAADF